MASSSTCRTWKYNVFPSFCGQDVRKAFLSHLLEKLRSKLIVTFIDNNIERSCPIGPELLTAIRESEISIVIFSKSYASSTWCLNELAEIRKCCEDLDQRVVPVFYEIDPSHVRNQTGEFGEVFRKTCEDKTEDDKKRWIRALKKVANIAGYDSRNWDSEAEMIEQISKDVSNKLFTTTTNDFGDFVGIDAHIESINSMLCMETEEVKMVGIVGPSGIGKTTIARALFSRLYSRFHHRAFRAYKRTIHKDYEMKLAWEEQFLSDILCQDIKLQEIGAVEQRLKHNKVLIVLDDVEDVELLKTLVGHTRWFGPGSRIIVITQDRELLKSHKINLIHEVEFPSEDIALKMFCQSAFGRNSPPDGFTELAVEVAKLAGNLPLGLNVLGSSLREKDKEEWGELMPRIQGGLDDKIGKILKVCYDRLGSKDDQELFLCIACLFNGESVSYINDLLESVYTCVNTRIKMLAHKSLIRITTPEETVQMHTLLQKLAREIVREESINDPGKRRFLVDLKDIREVLTNKTGTETILGICLNQSYSDINEPLTMDKNSFEGMLNLQFIKFYVPHPRCLFTGLLDRLIESGLESLDPKPDFILKSHGGLVYLPPKLRLLHWDKYPWEYIPSNFKAEYLVELVMVRSKLKRLWQGTLPLQHLKKMDLYWSRDLKKIPNLSKAKNLKVLNLLDCSELMVLPKEVNFESLEQLHLTQCSLSKSFPRSRTSKAFQLIENIHRLTHLSWERCPLRCMPSNFRTEHLVELHMPQSKFEKLWERVQPLENLESMNMSFCKDLEEFPDLSKATKLKKLDMGLCTSLEVLPTDVNLEYLEELTLIGCVRLRSFPQISTSIKELDLLGTAIEEVPSWIENMSELQELCMSRCKRLKNISPSIFKLRHLKKAEFTLCSNLTSFSDASVVATAARITDFLDLPSDNLKYFDFHCCWSLDGNAQELILGLSIPMITILPGREVPTYFTHRDCGNSLIINSPQSSPSHEVLRFKACIVIESECYMATLKIHWRFRGLNGVKLIDLEFWAMSDHVVVFNFDLADFELNSHLRSATIEHKSRQCDIEFEFLLINDEIDKYDIKGCGIRLMDAESGRSKKQMQMTETTSEESSNSLNGQIIADKELPAPNLELSLGHGEAVAEVSSISKTKVRTSSSPALLEVLFLTFVLSFPLLCFQPLQCLKKMGLM